MIGWPSAQPLRPWAHQCAHRDYMDACMRYRVPGQAFCENHGMMPSVVCLCGSTRFWETFRDVGLDLTMAGVIVLSIGICAPDSMALAHPESAEGQAQKRALDSLHKRKIDMASEVLVLNVGGYFGDSTRGEIAHATQTGKPIRWLFPRLTPPTEGVRAAIVDRDATEPTRLPGDTWPDDEPAEE